MREIKFRAKKLRDNEWIIGDLSHTKYSDGRVNITMWEQTPCAELNIEIDKNTIGQYTGLKDFEGNEIYENDIVKIYDTQTGKFSESTYLILYNNKSEWTIDDYWLLSRKYHKCKVIGNYYENNELLV